MKLADMPDDEGGLKYTTIEVIKFPGLGIELHQKEKHVMAGLLNGPRGLLICH